MGGAGSWAHTGNASNMARQRLLVTIMAPRYAAAGERVNAYNAGHGTKAGKGIEGLETPLSRRVTCQRKRQVGLEGIAERVAEARKRIAAGPELDGRKLGVAGLAC